MPCLCGAKEKPVKSDKEKLKKVKRRKPDVNEDGNQRVTILSAAGAPVIADVVSTPRSARNSSEDHGERRVSFSDSKNSTIGHEKSEKRGRARSLSKSEEGVVALDPKSARGNVAVGASPKDPRLLLPVVVHVVEEREELETAKPLVVVPVESHSASSSPRQSDVSLRLPLKSLLSGKTPVKLSPSSERMTAFDVRSLGSPVSPGHRGSAFSRSGLASVGRAGSISMDEWSRLQADAKKEAVEEKERIMERKATLMADMTAALDSLKKEEEQMKRLSMVLDLNALDELALDGDELALATFKPEEYNEEDALEDVILEQKLVHHLEQDVQDAKEAITAMAADEDSLDLDDLNDLDKELDIDFQSEEMMSEGAQEEEEEEEEEDDDDDDDDESGNHERRTGEEEEKKKQQAELDDLKHTSSPTSPSTKHSKRNSNDEKDLKLTSPGEEEQGEEGDSHHQNKDEQDTPRNAGGSDAESTEATQAGNANTTEEGEANTTTKRRKKKKKKKIVTQQKEE